MKNTNNMKPTIYFDLDGTLYDLYNQPRWLDRITVDFDASAYAADDVLVDLVALHEVLDLAISEGYRVGVISWLAGGSPKWYDKMVRTVKRAWVKKFLPQATEVHIVKYGTPKHRVANDKSGVLVDDNAEVRAAWKGDTIDATQGILSDLYAILNA